MMRCIPAVHRVAVVVAIKMISVMTFAGFLSVAATIVVTSILLGQSKIAAECEYGRNEHC